MNRKRIVNVSMVVTLVLVSVLAAIPASADAPQHFETPIVYSGKLDNPCGFKIHETTDGITRSTFWYDENGQLVAGHNNITVTEIWDAGGNVLEFTYNYTVHGRVETYPLYRIVWLGIQPIVTLPGSGAVIKFAGQAVDIYEMNKKGELEFVENIYSVGVDYADWDTICEYLAP